MAYGLARALLALSVLAGTIESPPPPSPGAGDGLRDAGMGAGGGRGGGEQALGREAYVTLVTTPEYVIGAEVLARMLLHTGTRKRLVAMVAEDVPEHLAARLEAAGWEVLGIRAEDSVRGPRASEWGDPENRPHLGTSYDKIHVWGLGDAGLDKAVYLDADTLVLQNLDDLFARNLSSGYPFAAAPEIMPPDSFNTGVLVVRPSSEVHRRLVAAASTTPSFDGGDLGFLNAFFPDWFSQSAHHRLPFADNTLQTVASYYSPAWDAVRPAMRVLHFAGDRGSKPWSFSGAVPPSLGVYVYLWQSVARAPPGEDISGLFDVLRLDDVDAINALFHGGGGGGGGGG